VALEPLLPFGAPFATAYIAESPRTVYLSGMSLLLRIPTESCCASGFVAPKSMSIGIDERLASSSHV
jgi:hypothetical protein